MKNSENIKETDSYNFLLLSLYYYLKRNNYNQTAQKLFQESKLDTIFKFPEELKPPTNEKEKMQNNFIEYFYNNSFNNANFDFLGDFWSQFWIIFANKMMKKNKIETLFNKEQNNILKQTYTQKKISEDFLNQNNEFINNKSLDILSNIGKNTQNLGQDGTEDILNIMDNKKIKEKNIHNKININKNNNYYEEEEEEEGENDIEKEMDEENGISFNKQNCPNIIKQPNLEEMPHVELNNEYDNYISKNIYTGFPPINSSTHFDFNALNGNSNIKEERNMSAIPLRKDMENNNNYFDI